MFTWTVCSCPKTHSMCSKKALQNLKTLLKREKTIFWHASIGKRGSQMKTKNGLTMPATQLMKKLFSTCWKMCSTMNTVLHSLWHNRRFWLKNWRSCVVREKNSLVRKQEQKLEGILTSFGHQMADTLGKQLHDGSDSYYWLFRSKVA